MNTRMNHITTVLLLCGAAFLASCEAGTVELEPSDRITETTAFDTPQHCELSVTGVYATAQSGIYPGPTPGYRGYPFGAASIQQSDMRGEDMLNVTVFFGITYESTQTTAASSANLVAMWQNSFSVICDANLVIDGITRAAANSIITAAQSEEYIAECRFLRALTFHNLLIHFARPFAEQGNHRYGLPYYDYPLNTQENIDRAMEHGRNTLDECYDRMIEDLDYAESKLPAKRTENHISRATAGAAVALKTRILLHRGDWPGVRREAAKLVDDRFTSPVGGYALEADPSTPFDKYDSNTESIFSIENSSVRASTNGSLNTLYSPSSVGGRALVAVSPVAYNNPYWLAADKRRDMLLASSGVYFTAKYSRNVAAMSSYAPIIRYAEVLLNYAEAIIRDGGSAGDALPCLNAVRNRSLKNAADAYTADGFAAPEDFMNALLAERRIEFLAEGRRWEDIHRLLLDADYTTGGIPAKVSYSNMIALMKDGTEVYAVGGQVPAGAYFGAGVIPYSDRRCVWPIPESSTDRNEKLKSQQNEGW